MVKRETYRIATAGDFGSSTCALVVRETVTVLAKSIAFFRLDQQSLVGVVVRKPVTDDEGLLRRFSMMEADCAKISESAERTGWLTNCFQQSSLEVYFSGLVTGLVDLGVRPDSFSGTFFAFFPAPMKTGGALISAVFGSVPSSSPTEGRKRQISTAQRTNSGFYTFSSTETRTILQ